MRITIAKEKRKEEEIKNYINVEELLFKIVSKK